MTDAGQRKSQFCMGGAKIEIRTFKMAETKPSPFLFLRDLALGGEFLEPPCIFLIHHSCHCTRVPMCSESSVKIWCVNWQLWEWWQAQAESSPRLCAPHLSESRSCSRCMLRGYGWGCGCGWAKHWIARLVEIKHVPARAIYHVICAWACVHMWRSEERTQGRHSTAVWLMRSPGMKILVWKNTYVLLWIAYAYNNICVRVCVCVCWCVCMTCPTAWIRVYVLTYKRAYGCLNNNMNTHTCT